MFCILAESIRSLGTIVSKYFVARLTWKSATSQRKIKNLQIIFSQSFKKDKNNFKLNNGSVLVKSARCYLPKFIKVCLKINAYHRRGADLQECTTTSSLRLHVEGLSDNLTSTASPKNFLKATTGGVHFPPNMMIFE